MFSECAKDYKEFDLPDEVVAQLAEDISEHPEILSSEGSSRQL